ncbi:hypothetical protein E2C01_086477 [Portunus trituberculatus]|uniref:Uncharacterized protein n=1 Tax=Portunus trituberculatus TaxID=210409 RepID=A0A5B7JEP4_PORTR|nr:hypothetical protein [Portunus trituberculatus]
MAVGSVDFRTSHTLHPVGLNHHHHHLLVASFPAPTHCEILTMSRGVQLKSETSFQSSHLFCVGRGGLLQVNRSKSRTLRTGGFVVEVVLNQEDIVVVELRTGMGEFLVLLLLFTIVKAGKQVVPGSSHSTTNTNTLKRTE